MALSKWYTSEAWQGLPGTLMLFGEFHGGSIRRWYYQYPEQHHRAGPFFSREEALLVAANTRFVEPDKAGWRKIS